jgi:hypothetical protein
MKAFTQITKPHDDILEGKLTMDIFAADLWQVVTGKAHIDYLDSSLFFRKTYPTKGLNNILDIAKNRLEQKGGDAVIQLQTPFGGGKTHALIALYHRAKEWGTKVVVIDGTSISPKHSTPWEEIERQLTGKAELTRGDVPPGKEKLSSIISKNSPVLILMDEMLQYLIKAAAVKIGDSNLATQTLAFIQELTGTVSAVGNALLVITLPSSRLEQYNESGEKLFQQLQKISGRMEKIYTPVEEDEIEHVIRRRLFSSINENEAKKVVDEFVDHARGEGLISSDEVASYRERFLKSYPFKPEVIDILYKRWGSYPTFQRTRGVLRLLSLVIHDLLDKNIPFIRLGDFNLREDEIKRELIKHIGQEWDSIIAQDITSGDSGAKKVDNSMGSAYKPFKLGTAVSTAIFMMSFSGRGERGSSIKDIKLSTLLPDFSSTVIDTVIGQFKERLFYLSDEGLYFTNKPNLNRIILTREENIDRETIIEEEKRLIERHISKTKPFAIYLWPHSHRDIPDTPNLKLLILNKDEHDRDFIEKHGENPRVYRNTIILLSPDENQREVFYGFIQKFLALRSIMGDERLGLTESQKKEIKGKVEMHEKRSFEELRKYYRKIYLPAREGFKFFDMGLPTFGESHLDSEVYNLLRSEGEVLERISPAVITEKYLAENNHVETRKLFEAFLKTPGELRLLSQEAFKEGVNEGVEKGIFGLGIIEEDGIKCKYFNESALVELTENEVIIKPELCKKAIHVEEEKKVSGGVLPGRAVHEGRSLGEAETVTIPSKTYSKIKLKLDVPLGQFSTIVKILNYLNGLFGKLRIGVEITADEGQIKISDYENKIEEALGQSGVSIEEESKE